VGASTQVIATHFVDKQGLLDALFARGFDRLTEAVRQLPPGAGVAGCMHSYRTFAVENPQLYKLMFGRLTADYAPGAEAKQSARRCFEALVAALPRVAGAGGRPSAGRDEATAQANLVWAVAHGHVALELADLVVTPPSPDVTFDRAVRAVEAVSITDLVRSPRRTRRSAR